MNLRPLSSVDWLVVHCSATHADEHIRLAEIRYWHMQRGYSDIGYHYVIPRDGSLELGRATSVPGAHAPGYNLNSLGICLVGGRKSGTNFAENNFTDLQFSRLRSLLSELRETYPDAQIVGHRDLAGVGHKCPAFDVQKFLQETAE